MAKQTTTVQTETSDGTGLFKVEDLKEKYKTPESAFCGVCAGKNWRAGTQVTEGEYTKAVQEFLHAPLGRSK